MSTRRGPPVPARAIPPGGTGRVDAAVVVEDASVDYGDGPVLHDFDLVVRPGEWVGLVGPNGAGKSTALGILSGLVAHDGRLRVGGHDPAGWRRRDWATTVALVPQRPLIPPGLTVTDYVLLGRTAHIPPFGVESADDLAEVAWAIRRLDLAGLARRPVLALSGGELQRVVLARALVQRADVLLLDEPTSALDLGHGLQVLELVDALRSEQGLTIVAAMHDLTLASQFTDRVVLLDQGRVVATGTPAEVLTSGRLARHYHANVRVLADGVGGIVVIPVRDRVLAERTRPPRDPPPVQEAAPPTPTDAPPDRSRSTPVESTDLPTTGTPDDHPGAHHG